MTREDLGLMPEEDGASVYGNITLQDDDVEINALKAGKSGYTISPTIDEVNFVDHDVKRVIAVETMGMFHRMVQESAYKKFDCLIVGLKGQAARATRRFLKRVNEELKLPVYVCNDGDPWGSTSPWLSSVEVPNWPMLTINWPLQMPNSWVLLHQTSSTTISPLTHLKTLMF
jgi:DNA topoisomerase-6 subunit A